MKQSLISISILLLLLPALRSIDVQLLSSTPYFASGSNLDILYQTGNVQLIYHENNGILASSFFTYDTSSGAQTPWVANYPCEWLDTGVFVTANNQLYCFGYENVVLRKNVSIHLLNPSGGVLNRVSKSYSCSGCLPNTIQTTTDGVAIVGNENSAFTVFYPQTGQVGCTFAVHSEYYNFVYTATQSVVVAAGLDYETSTYFIGLISCQNQDLLVYSTFNFSQISNYNVTNQYVNVYNQSTLGLSVLVLGEGTAVFTVVDLQNNFVNSNFVISNYAGAYWKVNDTTFAILTYKQSFVVIGLYVINNNLELIQIAYHNLNFFGISAVDVIPNSNNVIIYPSTKPCNTLEYIQFNIQTFTISNFYTENAPLYFSNGSVVYYSCQGYYITNANKSSTVFINLPVSQYITYPSNYNVVYGFYTSNATDSIIGCYLSVFDANSSSVTVNLLNSCPCDLCIDTMPGLFVYDISINSAGENCITYQTGLGGIYIIIGMKLYSTNIYGEGGDLVFPDYNNGILRVWVSAGQDSTIEIFNFLNDSVINSTAIPINVYSAFKLDNANAFVECQYTADQGNFYVYNVIYGNITFSYFTKAVLYTPTNGAPNAAIFGFSPSTGRPAGFVVRTKFLGKESLLILSSGGNLTELSFKTDINVTATNNLIFEVQDFNASNFGTSYLYLIQSLSSESIEI
jgi:hypothetical protein